MLFRFLCFASLLLFGQTLHAQDPPREYYFPGPHIDCETFYGSYLGVIQDAETKQLVEFDLNDESGNAIQCEGMRAELDIQTLSPPRQIEGRFIQGFYVGREKGTESTFAWFHRLHPEQNLPEDYRGLWDGKHRLNAFATKEDGKLFFFDGETLQRVYVTMERKLITADGFLIDINYNTAAQPAQLLVHSIEGLEAIYPLWTHIEEFDLADQSDGRLQGVFLTRFPLKRTEVILDLLSEDRFPSLVRTMLQNQLIGDAWSYIRLNDEASTSGANEQAMMELPRSKDHPPVLVIDQIDEDQLAKFPHSPLIIIGTENEPGARALSRDRPVLILVYGEKSDTIIQGNLTTVLVPSTHDYLIAQPLEDLEQSSGAHAYRISLDAISEIEQWLDDRIAERAELEEAD